MRRNTTFIGGVKYVTVTHKDGTKSIHNETLGASYVLDKTADGYRVLPCNAVTLQHTGYSIGLASSIRDAQRVIHSFEY